MNIKNVLGLCMTLTFLGSCGLIPSTSISGQRSVKVENNSNLSNNISANIVKTIDNSSYPFRCLELAEKSC